MVQSPRVFLHSPFLTLGRMKTYQSQQSVQRSRSGDRLALPRLSPYLIRYILVHLSRERTKQARQKFKPYVAKVRFELWVLSGQACLDDMIGS